MSVKPPTLYNPSAWKDPLAAALEQEILAEKAGTLARLTRKLTAALADLASAGPEDKPVSQQILDQRLTVAGEALWHVTIQRELCGFNRHTAFYDSMGVPAAVRLRMGPAKAHAQS